ncbi:MAG TPA: hypothetical protein VNM24_16060 [Burkholderiales bacterium]|jgi:hypothetical protein|nr:hypothetical protein [Burkholderiales bacterium]
MSGLLRLRLVEPLLLGGYFLLLAIGARLESREGWMGTLGVIAVLAFLAWTLSFKRMLAITDTPTSRIASAAQGYVELTGRGFNHPSAPVLSKLTGLPCLWYRYKVERRTSNNKWEHVASGVSTESFLLDDGTARCLVDPEFAEVVPRNKDTWIKDGYRYTEWLILPQEKIYAIGQFSTVGGANSSLDFNRDVSELLAHWKQDKAALVRRFDLNRDGVIGEEEWMLARQQARREVRKRHRQILSESGTHVLHKPADGRPFLISNLDPARLARRYRVWTGVHLAAFVGAAGAASWLILG